MIKRNVSIVLLYLIFLGATNCDSFIELEHQIYIEDIRKDKEFVFDFNGYTSNVCINILDTISCDADLILSDSTSQDKFYSTELNLKKGDFVNKRVFDWYEDGITIKYVPKGKCEKADMNIQLIILTSEKVKPD